MEKPHGDRRPMASRQRDPFASAPEGERLAEGERKRTVPTRAPEVSRKSVFLNIPYDEKFRRLYLAYISGLAHIDLRPRATIEIPGGQNRMDKIFDLIRSCPYSIHDLSLVQLDRTQPATPRFNMPFELGLAVACARIDHPPHDWFVFESMPRRLSKSLSDLSGIDPYIHRGTVEGVMRELCNCFSRQTPSERTSVSEMLKTYRVVSHLSEEVRRKTRARSLFEASVFERLCFVASTAAGLPVTR